MKIRAGIPAGIVICLLAFAGCNKKSLPAITTVRSGKSFDSSTYSYIYVEAIKEKLLGNTGDAMKYLEHCLKVNPNSDAAYYQMAQMVSANGDLASGKKYLVKALEIEPKNIWYLMMMSSLCYQTSSIDSSLMYYERAADFFPENDELQLTLGKMYSETRNYEKAIKIFSRLDSKFGVNENSTVLTVKNLIAAGRLREAEEKTGLLMKEKPDEVLYNGLMAEIYQAEGEKEKAMEVYDMLIKRNPDNPMIQLSLASFLIDSKKYDELFKLLNTITINQDIELEDKLNLFGRMIDYDEIVSTEGVRLQLALIVLESNYGSNGIVPLLRTDMLMKKKDLQGAGNLLEELVKKYPENYYAWEKLLFVYLEQKDYKNLEARGEECSRTFNRSFVAKLLYANGAMENKNYATALEELRKSEILAGSDKTMKTQVLTMRADLYYRMKDYQKAFMTYDEALKLNSDDLTLINNYAYYLAEQNIRLREAEEMAKKVIEKERSNTSYLDTYGWVLYKRGKLKAAEKIMLELISGKEPPDAEWFEHYGYILKAMKKCDDATKIWQQALDLDRTKNELVKEIEDCRGKR